MLGKLLEKSRLQLATISPLFNQLHTVQVNLCQKHLFLHQLTHNMTTDCSLNHEFSTWKFQAQNCVHKLFFVLTFRTIYVHNMFSTCYELGIFMYWTRNSLNNLSSCCGLGDARISASDKYLPAFSSMMGMIDVVVISSGVVESNVFRVVVSNGLRVVVCCWFVSDLKASMFSRDIKWYS